MDELLLKFGIDKNKLNAQELITLNNWAVTLEKTKLGVADIKDFLNDMISSIEKEICGYEYPKGFSFWLFRKTRNKHLEARLYSYIMLRDFITSPEKARSYIEKSINNSNLVKKSNEKTN
jgi:hypothetical protein